MIPRYQKIILWVLLISTVFMAAYLIRLRARAQDQLAAIPDAAPMPTPAGEPPVPVTFILANDADGSLVASQHDLALPADVPTRARAILNDLFAVYAQQDSPHRLPELPAVSDVFLLPVPTANDTAQSSSASAASSDQLAVVNLTGGFVDHHPSGIEVETLTLLSILGTLHADLPQITQVRFLVDGQPRDTLAGHADLTRTYLTEENVPQPAASDPSTTPQESTPPRASPEGQK